MRLKRVLNCIVCFECGSKKVKVIDSRRTEALGFATKKRRRVCMDCNSRYNTLEIPEHFLEQCFGEEP